MKRVAVAIVGVVMLVSVAVAGPHDPPSGRATAIAGASAVASPQIRNSQSQSTAVETVVGVGVQVNPNLSTSAINSNLVLVAPSNDPTFNNTTQPSASATIVNPQQPLVTGVVTDTPKAIATSLPSPLYSVPPYATPPALETQQVQGFMAGVSSYIPRTPGSNVTLWAHNSTFEYADIPSGEAISKDVEINYTSIAAGKSLKTKAAPTTLTIHRKGGDPRLRTMAPTHGAVMGVGYIVSKKPFMSYAQLEYELDKFAATNGASGINELDRHIVVENKTSGYNLTAQLGAAITGSAQGQGAIWGPLVGATYMNIIANLRPMAYIEFELER